MVSISSVKTENGKVSCETPEGTVINININQRSCMDSLMDAIKGIRIAKKDGQGKEPVTEIAAKESPSGLYLGVGVSFISLGIMGVMLAIIFQVAMIDLTMRYSGTCFWVGFPFIVSGVVNVLAYKYPKTLWVVVAFIGMLLCLAVSIAGIVFVAGDIDSFWWRNNMESRCDDLLPRQNGYYYRTTPPRYYGSYDSKTWELENCKAGFRQFKNLLFGLLIMSLVIMIWGLCVSAITLIYRLKVFVSNCRCEKVEEEEKDDALLQANPTPDVFIA